MNKTIKGACLVAATAMLPLSQAATAGEVNISGWVNESMMYYDDGQGSDVVSSTDNGTTLNSRITFTGNQELPNTGSKAGFEITFEPTSGLNGSSAFGSSQAPLSANGQGNGFVQPSVSGNQGFDENNAFGANVGLLASNLWLSGGWGKLTLGTQGMPTDNIAVLEDPSVTLWTNVAPVFRGGNFTIQGLTGAAAGTQQYAHFLQCLGIVGGIGIDCNGIYRNGVRYDLPTFAGVDIAVGYANDDIYDIAAKYKTSLAGLNAQLAVGYSINQGGVAGSEQPTFAGRSVIGTEAETFQMQFGLMDPGTGIFGGISYQHEDADGGTATVAVGDDTDAYYIKVGVKRAYNSLGDTSIHFAYGSYNDQFGNNNAVAGVTGSEIERISVGVTQYLGAAFQIYGTWEQLDLDVDCNGTTAITTACNAAYGGAEELSMFNMGAVYFF